LVFFFHPRLSKNIEKNIKFAIFSANFLLVYFEEIYLLKIIANLMLVLESLLYFGYKIKKKTSTLSFFNKAYLEKKY
jgi:hypothetical protein